MSISLENLHAGNVVILRDGTQHVIEAVIFTTPVQLLTAADREKFHTVYLKFAEDPFDVSYLYGLNGNFALLEDPRDIVEIRKHEPENHRWFSSEILFVTAADMVRCVNEIRTFVGENNPLEVHPAQTGIHLDGYFDLTDKLDQIQEIIKKHASFAMQEYSIKSVSITQDGYFSGWCEQYNRHGELIKGINLSEFFVEGKI